METRFGNFGSDGYRRLRSRSYNRELPSPIGWVSKGKNREGPQLSGPENMGTDAVVQDDFLFLWDKYTKETSSKSCFD